MKQMVHHKKSRYPGNKRHRGAALVWTERDEDGADRQRTAGRAERAAVLSAAPAINLVGALARDEFFMVGLEAVFSGEETSNSLAARYQRRNSYGFRVMLFLIESAIQAAIRVGDPRGLGVGLMLAVPPVTFFEDAEPSPRDRKRFRPLGWRTVATQGLLDRGASRSTPRTPVGVPQEHPEQERSRHDSTVASIRDLMAEFGSTVGIP